MQSTTYRLRSEVQSSRKPQQLQRASHQVCLAQMLLYPETPRLCLCTLAAPASLLSGLPFSLHRCCCARLCCVLLSRRGLKLLVSPCPVPCQFQQQLRPTSKASPGPPPSPRRLLAGPPRSPPPTRRPGTIQRHSQRSRMRRHHSLNLHPPGSFQTRTAPLRDLAASSPRRDTSRTSTWTRRTSSSESAWPRFP